jgi:SH3-like domain-containing protein
MESRNFLRRFYIGAVMLLCFFCINTHVIASDDKEPGVALPRFASLKVDEVNMRIGPGSRYAIKWVYKHEGLPVEIIQEFDAWREIRDSDGTVGWVHKQMLQSKRMAVIKSKIGVLKKSPEENAGPVIRAESGVIGKIIECEINWCRIQISGHKGWIPKASIWGVYKSEKF